MNVSLAVMGLSGGELLVVLGAILILFGAKRIPEFAKGLGKAMNEFKKASNEVTRELHSAMEETPSYHNSGYNSTPSLPPTTSTSTTSANSDSPSPDLAHNTPPDTVPKT
jgi:sec-independent protein translocase protein TatA